MISCQHPLYLWLHVMKRVSYRRSVSLFTALVLAVAATASCTVTSTTQQGAVGVDRRQYMMVSEAEVVKSAALSYDQEKQKAGNQNALNNRPELTRRVRAISDRLIPHTRIFRADALQWNWEINVQSSAEVNAYCMPGGKIMVYSGLIDKLQASDAELAAVIGHEIAHALREHTRERVSRAYAQQIGLTALAVLTGAGDTTMSLAGSISQVTFGLPHSREQEAEADRIGLELMARAGYDPTAAVSLWQKMAQQGSGSTPELLSTHPSSDSRIKELRDNTVKVLPLYEAAIKP